MAYVNDLGDVNERPRYQQRYWSLAEIVNNNLCLHLDGYPRNKGPIQKSLLDKLRQRGWTEKERRTGLEFHPIVRFLCPPGVGPDDGVQD